MMISNKEWGDFQTPENLAEKVCLLLRNKQVKPDVIIEPTCGKGNFISVAKDIFSPEIIIGLEKNADYVDILADRFHEKFIEIHEGDFFQYDWSALSKRLNGKSVLLLGNPPWVTSSAISYIDGTNLPLKSNFKKRRGLDALTGSSNFDICESIIVRLINSLAGVRWLAMLCKTSVARSVFEYLSSNGKKNGKFELYHIDAKRDFSASVSACLMYIDFSHEQDNLCRIYRLSNPDDEIDCLQMKGGQICPTKTNHEIDGHSVFVWRQGIKHDCAGVMEMRRVGDKYVNKNGEIADIEDGLVFPLVKSSDFKSCEIFDFSKYVVVTQRNVKDDTSYIKNQFPKTWSYLQSNMAAFTSRKSAIYNNAPMFSMFGVGEYTFSKYKVGLSGFYKEPLFSLLSSDKSVMVDDTCYYISFDKYEIAYVAMLVLNSPLIRSFLMDISFHDAKRPYTKKVLQRIDFNNAMKCITYEKLREVERDNHLNNKITESMYASFLSVVGNCAKQKEFSFM